MTSFNFTNKMVKEMVVFNKLNCKGKIAEGGINIIVYVCSIMVISG